ncbi:glycosyltransferase 87 family protein [Cryobacterium sp. PH29-G1]|uniref:glycosyltransferase 87 family protein n=1 Tax=Cryobacterium sp. PH29-G1 TaxID=3046211 RepID=UPI0024BB7792|nr:glycosyltransferase 87 family protein [Cryobacterium sp. PH29-G1]MDJ0349851.1 glycosyltransferase 87 family protein [Cryobacterium sp. PH29-G1]
MRIHDKIRPAGRWSLRQPRHPLTALWSAFVLVHLLLIGLALFGPGYPLGDVEGVYRGWAANAGLGSIVGITEDFVYPVLALVPVVAAYALGGPAYLGTWFALVCALNAGAFYVLLRHRSQWAVARWWLLFLALLGPIALVRIDSVTVPVCIVALLWLRRRPLCGTVLLTIATWIKIWPVAALAALFVASKQRWHILGVAAAATAAVVAVAATLSLSRGSGLHVLSFVGEQAGRGIQIESPVAVPWLWQAAFGVPGSFVYYDRQILTFQVAGAGTSALSAAMTPLLALAAAMVLLLGVRAQRRGAGWLAVLPPLTLALTATLIAFNKVGSPQFISWFAAPLILGLVLNGRAWRMPALLGLVLAALTQIIYPTLYDWVLVANPILVFVLSLRNLLEFVLLGWALHSLYRLTGAPSDSTPSDSTPSDSTPSDSTPSASAGPTTHAIDHHT